MSDLPLIQKNQLEHWADRARALGWLPDVSAEAPDPAEAATPGQLFRQTDRPLVAGLFGGTGVGKSTLLNRLAGEVVARASAERPTSRDVTVYVHRHISVEQLPHTLPMERVRVSLHSNNEYRQVMFIDMPDFDSVETANRDLVNLWLPHLDVVMYVVSPERYRDDQGWQLLQQHAAEHAWLFIINQWDRASPAIRDDFIGQLAGQGLSQPLVFCTDCASDTHAPGADIHAATDDFANLHSTLLGLSEGKIIKALEEHGVVARLQSLKTRSDQWLPHLGDDEQFASIIESWLTPESQPQDEPEAAMQWQVAQVARAHADTAPFWRRLVGWRPGHTETNKAALTHLSTALIDRLERRLEQFCNQQAHQHDVPLAAVRHALMEPHHIAMENTQQTLEDALDRRLHNPGTRWQRLLVRVTQACCLLLPLAALGWISYRVITAFAQGGSDPGAYLGSPFAINGALLIGLSWLLPAIAHTALTPSREQAARQGLTAGIVDSCRQSTAQVHESLKELASQSLQLRSEYQLLWAELPAHDSASLPESVRRMLSTHIAQTPVRRLDVRANTQSSTDVAPQS